MQANRAITQMQNIRQIGGGGVLEFNKGLGNNEYVIPMNENREPLQPVFPLLSSPLPASQACTHIRSI